MAHLVCELHKRRSVVIDGKVLHRRRGADETCDSKRVKIYGKTYLAADLALELAVLKAEGQEPVGA